jgi:CubicO group peptidase (beta-lactamase class C family)
MAGDAAATGAHHWEDHDGSGWSPERLAQARTYAASIGTDALFLVQQGRVVDRWGAIESRFRCHSIRKSILSALIGISVEEGRIDLSATLADLDIDDEQGLTDRERRASVLDLLCARSGIYHPTVAETDRMRAIREARHSHGPGTFWCYNNWDFNALGTIYERFEGRSVFEAFRDRLAVPLGFQDYRFDEERRDGCYSRSEATRHPAYPFRLTARDLARFGQLFLQRGTWGGREVVPRLWVDLSVSPISDAGHDGAYGYMWWVSRAGIHFPGVHVPEGTYTARGAGGHYVCVVPARDLVVVHRVDTDQEGKKVDKFRFGRLLGLILDAMER